MLGRLREAGLTVKPSKCLWAWQCVEYLGHQVGAGKISVPEAKVKAIENYIRPVTKRQLKSYLGLMSYYRKFIGNYAAIAAPLVRQTLDKAPRVVVWTEELGAIFDRLCKLLYDACTLHIPCASDLFVVQSDMSYDSIGACLSILRGKEELPIHFSQGSSRRRKAVTPRQR